MNGARLLGEAIARAGWTLIYGGGGIGLMGVVADGALDAGGHVVGVIPQSLFDREVAHPRIKELKVVGSMHERKALMASLSSAFIAMPGGIGTLDEIFEIWTWAQLQIHDKPVGFLNVEGFYDRLFGFLNQITEDGFLAPVHREMVLVDSEPTTLLARLAEWKPPLSPKPLVRPAP